jgi:nitroreductase
MEMMEVIKNRRSVTKYLDKEVEIDKINNLLHAAMQAPSSANEQPWEFMVIRDHEMLEKLSHMNPHAEMIKDANCAIIVMGNTKDVKDKKILELDCAAATENILLEVVNEGLGAVWVGVAPHKADMKFIHKLFNLPKEIVPFAIIPIGYPAEAVSFVDRYNEKKVHFDMWH